MDKLVHGLLFQLLWTKETHTDIHCARPDLLPIFGRAQNMFTLFFVQKKRNEQIIGVFVL